MKKVRTSQQATQVVPDDEILPEYDFSKSRPNPYAARYAAGALAITLDPDVAKAFPSAERANSALRAMARVIRQSQALPRRRTA